MIWKEPTVYPPLAKEIIESVGATKAGLTMQFSGEKENTAAALRQVDLALGEQRQALISYYRHIRTHPPTLKHPRERFSYSEKVEIKPELEFWRSLYTCTKSTMKSVLETPLALQGIEKEEAVETKNEEDDVLFEKLKNYRFEDAIEDLRKGLPFSLVGYENFLPKSHTIPHSRLFQISGNSPADLLLDKPDLYNLVLNDEDKYIYEVNLSPLISHICSPL